MGPMTAVDLPSWTDALPCPLSAGWELVRQQALPRRADDGKPLGGFSAAAYAADDDKLWLLSDAPQGHLVPVRGLARWIQTGRPLEMGLSLMLRRSQGKPLPVRLDGEGLVLRGDQAWIVSEGHRQHDRPAQLLRVSLRDGRLEQQWDLPRTWQFSDGFGLATNKGPESLTSRADGSLLVAAEAPLLQDKSAVGFDQVRLAAFSLDGGWRELGSLPIGPAVRSSSMVQGLTELLALQDHPGVLALVRRYQPPAQWGARLVLHSGAPVLQPLVGWDLLDAGLPADNWEGLAWGPRLPDGRRTLVAVSDDNFNPLQRSWVTVLAPRHASPFGAQPARSWQCGPGALSVD